MVKVLHKYLISDRIGIRVLVELDLHLLFSDIVLLLILLSFFYMCPNSTTSAATSFKCHLTKHDLDDVLVCIQITVV